MISKERKKMSDKVKIKLCRLGCETETLMLSKGTTVGTLRKQLELTDDEALLVNSAELPNDTLLYGDDILIIVTVPKGDCLVKDKVRDYKRVLKGYNFPTTQESQDAMDQQRAEAKAEGADAVLGRPADAFLCDFCGKKIRDGITVGSNTHIIQIHCKECAVQELNTIIRCAEADRVRVIFIGQATAFTKPYYARLAVRTDWHKGMPEWENYAKRCNLILLHLSDVRDTKWLIDLLYSELGISE